MITDCFAFRLEQESPGTGGGHSARHQQHTGLVPAERRLRISVRLLPRHKCAATGPAQLDLPDRIHLWPAAVQSAQRDVW